MKTDKEYTARALQEGMHVKKKIVGEFTLDNGLQVFLRSFNIFNLTLWDDVMQAFGELTADDILVRSCVQCQHLDITGLIFCI